MPVVREAWAMADSSWYRNPSGGRKYHKIRKGIHLDEIRSVCGLPMLETNSKKFVEGVSEILKCKKCNRSW